MQVSVVIPTFNRAYCIKRAITSALSQDVHQTEVIVIDDGSEDDTESVVGSIADARLKYIKKANGGVSSARNIGLDVATGSFFAFLDSDDYWPENYLKTMVSALDRHPEAVLAYCMTGYVKSDGSLLDSFPVDRCKSGAVTQDLFDHHFVSISGTVVRSGSIKGLRFDESLANMEDPDFFLRLSLKGNFLFVDEIKVPRTDSPGSLSKGFSENALFVRERFYFELGGREYIAREVAFGKLSRVCVRLGKECYEAGNYSKARELLFKSIKYNPSNTRAYGYLVAATARSLF